MLKLSLPPPPLPKRKRRKNKEAQDETPINADVVASLEMLADRIGIMRQTAAALDKEQDKNEQEASSRDWAATFCYDVLRPL